MWSPAPRTASAASNGACEGVVISDHLYAEQSLALRNLTINGTLQVGGETGEFSCTDCDFEGSAVYPLVVSEGAHMDLERVTITDVAVEGTQGVGLLVTRSASVSATALVIDGAYDGVLMHSGGSGEFHGLTIRNIDRSEGVASVALWVEDGQVTARDVVIDNVKGIGVAAKYGEVTLQNASVTNVWNNVAPAFFAVDEGVLNLSDVSISGTWGAGVVAGVNGTLNIHGAEFGEVVPWHGEEGIAKMAIAILPGGFVNASDLVFDGDNGDAIVVQGGSLQLERAEIGPGSGNGIYAVQGGTAVLRDVNIVGRTGVGVGVTDSSVLAERVTVTSTQRPSLLKLGAGFAVTPDSWLELIDVEAHGTQGYGIVAEGAEIQCTNCLVKDSLLAGVLVSNGSVGTFEGLTIDGVGPEGSSLLAMGLFVGSTEDLGADVTVSDVTIANAGFAGVWVEDGTLALSDFSVGGGPRVELLEDVYAFGHAVYGRDAVLNLQSGTLHDADGAGLFLHHSSDVAVSEVSFSDNAVDVWQQACEETIEVDDVWSTVTCPSYDEAVVPMDYFGIVDLN
jgi:hypothetical protein